MTTSKLSANRFYRLVREFATTSKPWQTAIRYNTLPDEAWDITLVSLRVYGTRNEHLAIMAAAGLDRVEQELTPRLLILPTADRLVAYKAMTGYGES